METKNSYYNMAIGAIALAGVIMFSLKSVFVKMVFAYNVDPVTTLYLRMVIALPFVVAAGVWYELKHKGHPVLMKDVALVAGFSVLGYYISSIFDFAGLRYVEASIERLILFLYPTMVIILSAMFLKKRITITQVIAIALSYAGLFITFADKLSISSSHLFWYGALLIALSSFTYAIFLTAADGLIARIGAFRFTTVATLTMALCIVLHAALTGKAHLTGFHPKVYEYSIYMAILSTVIPVYMFNFAMSKIGASNVSIISCMGPVCTLFFSVFMISEVITIFQIIGTIVVMSGILFMYVKKTEET